MKSFKNTLILLLIMTLGAWFVPSGGPSKARATAGDEQIYTAAVPPLVLLVMGRNHKLYYEAYNDASDLNDDGNLDVRYNPQIDYYGYFDCYKCYTYSSANSRFEPASTTTDKTCTGADDDKWSGNFLNYLTMSRMDTLRKVLYGGYRSTDTSTETVLERAFIPQDGHSWGKEYNGSAIEGYNIADYTPLTEPIGWSRHIFVSTTLSDAGDPLLRVLENSVFRVWEWVSCEVPVAGSEAGVPTRRSVTDNGSLGTIEDVTDGGAAGTASGSGNYGTTEGDLTEGGTAGTVTDCGLGNPAGEEFDKAFDDLVNYGGTPGKTKWLTWGGGGAWQDVWIQFQFDTPQEIDKYALTTANDEEGRDPKTWTLQASNDGSSWTDVDTVEDGALPSTRGTRKEFTCDNPPGMDYTYYRLYITAKKGGGDCSGKLCVQICEIELLGDVESGPDNAFDDSNATKWYTTDDPSTGSPVWLQFRFNEARAILKYTLTTAADTEDRDPKAWTLEASNDLSSWTVVDTVEDGALPSARGQKTEFICDSPPTQAYIYYRLNVTGKKGSTATGVQLAEMEMMEATALPPASATLTDYEVRVKVCDPSMLESNSKEYPSGDYKPVGILQKHGETGRMYFGLLTGSYMKNTSGGVLRKAIGPITDEIDADTGEFKYKDDSTVHGIIKTIDKFRVYGFDYGSHSYNQNCGWITTSPLSEGHCRMWGNPTAEMMYEGLRYFSGKGSATSSFTYSSGDDVNLGLPLATWDDPFTTNNYCAKPFMLVLSDINPTYDSDQLPGSYFGSFSGDSTFNSHTMNVETLADTISSTEGISGSHYVGQEASTYDGSCLPKSVSGFGDIRGLCPEEPTKQGSYYAASVAYFGRTNDISAASSIQNVLTYVVGLASPLPRIDIQVGSNTVTLVPFAKSVQGSSINSARNQFQPTNTIVDFYVQSIEPAYGMFRINYEDVEQGADHDMDCIAIYEYQVVDTNGDPVTADNLADGVAVDITTRLEYAAGGITQHCGFIISGTTVDGTYLEIRDETSASIDIDYFLDTPPGVGPNQGPSDTNWQDGQPLPQDTTRRFYPNTSGSSAATLLTNPLWYAAKWGGFMDLDEDTNPKPDKTSEWDEDGDGMPDTYFYVINPLRLEEQLNQSFADILSRGVSHVAPVVSVDEANRTQSGDEVYMAFFRPMAENYWEGNLKKYGLSYMVRTDCSRTEPEWTVVDKNGDIAGDCDGTFHASSISYWSDSADGGKVNRGGAGGELESDIEAVSIGSGPYYNFRNIYTYKSGSFEQVIPTNTDLTNADFGASSDSERYKIINQLYGYTYDEDGSGNPVAKRDWVLGDIIHSEPRIIDYFSSGSLSYRYIVVGANDGMLHVFTDTDATIGSTSYSAGSEIFAFVPPDLLTSLKDLADVNEHEYMVDGSPNLFRATTQTGGYNDKILVFGERRGGRSYWALNVTNPNPANWTVLWHIQGGVTSGFSELGYTWSKPFFTTLQTGAGTYKNVAIFSGGYDTLEDGFPEDFDDDDDDGAHDSGETFTDTSGGTAGTYDTYNPGMDTMGRGIYVVDISDGSLVFSATYATTDVTTGTAQTYSDMKYCFPADISVIPFSARSLVMYAADIYGQIWKVTYDYMAANQWAVKRVFSAIYDSNLATGATGIESASLGTTPSGRKVFYSPDVSYFGNCWTDKPVLFFGTGDRAHPRYTMISNRFYFVADFDGNPDMTTEVDLLNLTCDELDDEADADHDGDVDVDDDTRKLELKTILETPSICRGFYRVMDKQGPSSYGGDCEQCSDDHRGEQVLSQPTLFFKIVYFTSYRPVFDDPCNPVGDAFIYALDYCWGTAALNLSDDNGTDQDIRDTYQIIAGSSIPSGVRIITRGGHAAGLISAGGSVSGVGEDLTTKIPEPPGGVSQILWETD